MLDRLWPGNQDCHPGRSEAKWIDRSCLSFPAFALPFASELPTLDLAAEAVQFLPLLANKKKRFSGPRFLTLCEQCRIVVPRCTRYILALCLAVPICSHIPAQQGA